MLFAQDVLLVAHPHRTQMIIGFVGEPADLPFLTMALLASPSAQQAPTSVREGAQLLADSEAAQRREQIKSEFQRFKETIEKNDCVIFSTTVCPYCDDAKEYMTKLNRQCKSVELDFPENRMLGAVLTVATDQRTVPNIFLKGRHVGGLDGLLYTHEQCAKGTYAIKDIQAGKGDLKGINLGTEKGQQQTVTAFQRPVCDFLMAKC